MKLRARLRKIILWSATNSSVLLAVVWIWSGRWSVFWSKGDEGFVFVQSGQVFLAKMPENLTGTLPRSPKFIRDDKGWNWSFGWSHPGGGLMIEIPLWAPLALTSAIAAFAWRREVIARRRANQHKCPACGYEMTGLAAAAPCPECGKKDAKA